MFRGCCTAVPHKKERRRKDKKRKREKNTLISQKGQHASILKKSKHLIILSWNTLSTNIYKIRTLSCPSSLVTSLTSKVKT